MKTFLVVTAILMGTWQLAAEPVGRLCIEYDVGSLEERLEDCDRLISSPYWESAEPYLKAGIHLNRGYIHLDLRRFDEAVSDADRALAAKPDWIPALDLRAQANADAGDLEEALVDYNEILSTDPSNYRILVSRGIVHRRLGDYEKAFADYDKAIEVDPDRAGAYNSRGWAHYLKEQYEDALADVERARELSPDPFLRSTRANILLALDRKEEALSEFGELARNGPPDLIRRFQQILTLRGYGPFTMSGEFSPELLSSMKQCIEDGCKLAFDIELDQSNPDD